MTEITFTDVSLNAGNLVIQVPSDQIGIAYNYIRNKKSKKYTLIIKEYKKKRSDDANAKLWALLGEMSEKLHIPPEEIYQGYIPDVGGNYWIMPVKPDSIPQVADDWCRGHIGRMIDDMGPCMSKDLQGYHNLKLYRGSSEYDSATFSRLLELVMQDCRQIGIEVMSEREKSLLLESIDEKRNTSDRNKR